MNVINRLNAINDYPNLDDAILLSKISEALLNTKVLGETSDTPEGSGYIRISNTLVKRLSKDLKSISNKINKQIAES
jgi:hypothetical protein